MNRVLLVAISLMSLGLVCGPGGGPPPPDSCGSASNATVSELELGPEMFEMRGFEAWAAEDTAYISEGIQGGYMLGVSLRLPTDAPACVKQKTTVSLGSRELASEDASLKTYEAIDGTRTTRTAWLVFDDTGPAVGSQVVVKTVAGGHTMTKTLTIAADRHRLESLTVIGTPLAGYSFEIEIASRVAPMQSVFELSHSYSNPGIVSAMVPQYVSSDVQRFQATALQAGQTDLIVTFRDQELRLPITVAP